MQTGKRRIIIICLITLITVCQLVPAFSLFSRCLDDGASVESLILISNSLHHSIPTLDTSATRPVFQKVPVSRFDLDFYEVDTIWQFNKSPLAFFQIVDIRSTIIETIPQYFNGSKYKNSRFIA